MSERVNKLRAQRHVQHGLNTRSCGTCNACCIVLGVAEIDKPIGEPCKYLATAKGCGIYATRPTSCRVYHCLWRAGQLEGADRPDRLGVVIDAAFDQSDLLFARESRAGALDDTRAMLEKLSHDNDLVIVLMRNANDVLTVIGSPEKVELYLDNANRKLRVLENARKLRVVEE